MKSATHLLKLLVIGVWVAEGLFSAPAIAGPATYDKESKSFRLTYTFANLAGHEKRKDRHCNSDPTSWQTDRPRRRSPLALRDMTTSGRWPGTVDGE